MNIFAAAADYASWITLLGVKPGDSPMSGYFDRNAFYLGAQPMELKIPVTGNKVFVKLGLGQQETTDYNSQFYYSYGDKFFTIYDNNGKLRVVLERHVSYYGLDSNGAYSWKTYHPVTGEILTTGDMWLGKAWENWRDIIFEVTTTTIAFYISDNLINTLDISSLGITGFGFIGFGKQMYWCDEPGMVSSKPLIMYLIVSDVFDHSLKAYPYKPKALGSGNQFTGTIDRLNSWLPDRTYMSSAAEYNVKCTFTLGVPDTGHYSILPEPNLNIEKIIQMDQYLAVRYVQTGGVSANFKIHSTFAGGPTDYTIACPANEKDTKSLIRKLPNTKTGDNLPDPKLGQIEISLEA